MNQTPASILVLAASVLGYAAAVRYYHESGVLIGLAGLAVGAWGVVSLVIACIRERELLIDSSARLDIFDRYMGRGPATRERQYRRIDEDVEIELPADLKAQLSLAAHMEGRGRSELVADALRRHLPRVTKNRSAA